MLPFNSLLAGALALSAFAQGFSIPRQESEGSIIPRGSSGIVLEILKAIKVFTEEPVYTWVRCVYPST